MHRRLRGSTIVALTVTGLALSLVGCTLADERSPSPTPSEIAEVDFEGERAVVAIEFSLYRATQDFDTSTYRVEDSDALRAFEALLTAHGIRDYETVLTEEEQERTGGLSLTLEYIDVGGETRSVDAQTSFNDFDIAVLELTSEWHETVLELGTGDNEAIAATVVPSDTQEAVDVTDTAALSDLNELLRDHGILTGYDSPIPLEPPTLGLPGYLVTAALADGRTIEMELRPDALPAAEFAQAALPWVEEQLA
ncbi:MAG TPA: hypothetical protein H9830_10505 [Candidatus Agrococcus pullicola]|uniref:Uncharacterized protein n=1 Tax=Candidatus Agrococcus pullicola TaxID=2838429 RepID=A0A9D2C9W8_9MICO|nr:hypothetical protein [Candidatus Agrococcus pullicola]